ncbi:SDR family oxidoreductase [Paramicrobacterium agarici]|uniref:SDR family oxidoreductase n=1 Tax=Paramicrobacterium agarici TaxID=630514 RepID=UPI000BFA1C56|nr:SDR family oxidoreductase [Microbacterium agarici]
MRLGRVDVLCISPLPNIELIHPVLETSAEELAASLALSVGGTATAIEMVVPDMIARGSGTVLVTTGSGAQRPTPDRAASAVATSAQTAYVDVLRDALAPRGVQVSQLVIVGPVGPGLKHEPDAVADKLWQRHESGTAALEVLDSTDGA